MTTDELKQEAEEYADKHYMKSFFAQADIYVDDKKEIINAILHFAEPREKRIAELEQENERLILGNKSLSKKLMNTTREKLDLQKENAELKEHIKADCIDCTDYYKNKRLEKENAELSMKRKAERKIFQGIVEKKNDQLTKAKRIIKNLMLFAAMDFREYEKEYKEAEQFLKDSEEK